MKEISPKYKDTEIDESTNEWIPKSFGCFIGEIDQLTSTCNSTGSLPLFRGHRERNWLLESTFARSFKSKIFNLSAEEKLTKRILNSFELHSSVLYLFLLKYGVLVRPSEELESIAGQEELDSWFELMKKFQQDPEKDELFLKGTNLIDWSQSSDIALFFANQKREGQGALYVCDTTATGKTLQTIPLGSILDKMNEMGKAGKQLGIPLLFCPKRQIKSQKARNQQAIYFAQMDLRYDLESIWRMHEESLDGEIIVIKIVLPADSQDDANEYLKKRGITTDFIYPDIS